MSCQPQGNEEYVNLPPSIASDLAMWQNAASNLLTRPPAYYPPGVLPMPPVPSYVTPSPMIRSQKIKWYVWFVLSIVIAILVAIVAIVLVRMPRSS